MLTMTFGIIAWTLAILFTSGYAKASDAGTSSFIILYSLFNIYMYIIAFLYSPATIYSYDMNKSREHENIINTLYETEMPDIKSDDLSEFKQDSNELHKRHLKKDKATKEKEKIWESIMNETGHDSSDDDDDEDEREDI